MQEYRTWSVLWLAAPSRAVSPWVRAACSRCPPPLRCIRYPSYVCLCFFFWEYYVCLCYTATKSEAWANTAQGDSHRMWMWLGLEVLFFLNKRPWSWRCPLHQMAACAWLHACVPLGSVHVWTAGLPNRVQRVAMLHLDSLLFFWCHHHLQHLYNFLTKKQTNCIQNSTLMWEKGPAWNVRLMSSVTISIAG